MARFSSLQRHAFALEDIFIRVNPKNVKLLTVRYNYCPVRECAALPLGATRREDWVCALRPAQRLSNFVFL